MELFTIALCVVLVTAGSGAESPQFHQYLTPDERKHYFGTDAIDDVPAYEYTSPQRLDWRRRRSTTTNTHLEYLVEAFGDLTHIVLDQNVDLLSPGCIVEHHKSNGTKDTRPCAFNEVDCFYTGRTGNHSDSWVAASVCGGMHGVIGTPDSTLMIQPVQEHHKSRVKRDTSIPNPHIVYRYQHNKRSCDSQGKPDLPTDKDALRRRRDTGKKYVETTVVADHTVYAFHGDETESMMKTIMNVVAQRFLDPSLQSELYFTLVKLIILEEPQAGLSIVPDSQVTLDSFCEWQTEWNPEDDSNPEHADYVALLTRLDLEYLNNAGNTGLARAGICGMTTHCSVNEDLGLASGFTVAHETGHVLGMNHDSGEACPTGRNIMSAMAASGPEAFKWSSCSAEAVKTLLRSPSLSSCLDDAPSAADEKLYSSQTKPGTIYTANHQCKLIAGDDAEACPHVSAEGQDVCGAIVCRNTPDDTCVIRSAPMMDGTNCGDRSERKWCIHGRCVAMGAGSPGPVDGGWSDWDQGFGQCSRSCGGGIKMKQRVCNKPEPMYGGKQCQGAGVQAELCNIKACYNSPTDFMTEQCSLSDSRLVSGNKYHWVADTGTMGDDSCKLPCNAYNTGYYMSRGVSKDGTDCNSDVRAAFSKCVAGKCKAFGCDGHADSGHSFDQCGVCNGKGDTCKKLSGRFHGGQGQVFTTFAHIPKGSTGIRITQSNQYCFLSVTVNRLKLFSDPSKVLSGTYNIGGVTLHYSKSPEHLDIVGPTSAAITAQVYRKYGAGYMGVDPDVYYEYHVPTMATTVGQYMWKTTAGKCTKTCGTGTQSPVITCENVNTGTVADFNCNIHDKPQEVSQPCHTQDCPPRWLPSDWSQCSQSCGGGQKHRIVRCIKESNNVQTVVVDYLCHGLHKPTTSSSCHREACPPVWRSGSWNKCSEPCGRGLKTREVKCYRSDSSPSPIPESNCDKGTKPTTQEYCALKPCRTDISGAACKDKKANCFQDYGEGVCNGQDKSWARDNCMKSCVICAENPTDLDSSCKDASPDCSQYVTGFCTNANYASWAKVNCQKHCGYCQNDCKDKDTSCGDYVTSMCTEYRSWALSHCQKFCGLCGASRRKRDAAGYPMFAPPLKPVAVDTDLGAVEAAVEAADIALDDDVVDAVPPVKIYDDEQPDTMPPGDILNAITPEYNIDASPQPLSCSQNYTAATGEISTTRFPAIKGQSGKLCELYITGTPGKHVQLVFTSFRMAGMEGRCSEEDALQIQDLDGGEIDMRCGELSSFIWEAQGSRVRLLYRQNSDIRGFTAHYSMHDL